MPIEPRDLLDLARRSTERPDALEADLRRAVSTAYYALFHLLIKAATTRFASDSGFRARLARGLQHTAMRSVCQDYKSAKVNADGEYVIELKSLPSQPQVFTADLRKVAEAFVALHGEREKADYDDGSVVQFTDALNDVQQAETAFASWLKVQDDPASSIFLQELICRSILKR